VLENQRSVHNTKEKLQTGKMNDTLLLLSFKNATLSNCKTFSVAKGSGSLYGII
jgi:hypothetical protein